jgi:hypothetical protein
VLVFYFCDHSVLDWAAKIPSCYRYRVVFMRTQSFDIHLDRSNDLELIFF